MLAFLLLAVMIVLLALFGLAATRPKSFRVEREIQINAAAESLFAIISDFNRWPAWSPWEKIDPEMTRTHSGTASGTGAVYEWKGNSKVGQGRMEIVKAEPPKLILIKLDFLKPFEAHNMAEFIFKPSGSGIQVTWAMYGPSPFLSRLIGLFISMDRMVGKDFEKGLGNLKEMAESR